MAKRKKTRPNRWTFRWKTLNNKTLKFYFLVTTAWKDAYLPLKEAHVLESIRRNGCGDTQNCPVAVCGQNSPEAFDHPVEGTVDLTYTRASVVSKVYDAPRLMRGTKKIIHGECVLYAHNHADIAKLNDSKNGPQKLLELVRKTGDMTLHLFPPPEVDTSKYEHRYPARGSVQADGSRSKRTTRGELRMAFAKAAMAGV